MLRTSTVNTTVFGMTPVCRRHGALAVGGIYVGLLVTPHQGGQASTTKAHGLTPNTYPRLDAVRHQGIPAKVTNVIKTLL